MNFEEALKLNGFGDRIEEQYGRWGHFTEENAKAIIKIADAEVGQGSRVASLSSMAMVAFTWANESSWAFNPTPNVNGKPLSPWNWDVGPFQLNLQWTTRIVWQGDFVSKGLDWKSVWGQSFYEEDGTTPAAFNGDVVANGRCALRCMLADRRQPGPLGFADRETAQIVLYTGPKAQPARLKNWAKYGDGFKNFFEAYLRKEGQ